MLYETENGKDTYITGNEQKARELVEFLTEAYRGMAVMLRHVREDNDDYWQVITSDKIDRKVYLAYSAGWRAAKLIVLE